MKKLAPCCDGMDREKLVGWMNADQFYGPDAEGWAIPVYSGGDLVCVNVEFCPWCGRKLEETDEDQ